MLYFKAPPISIKRGGSLHYIKEVHTIKRGGSLHYFGSSTSDEAFIKRAFAAQEGSVCEGLRGSAKLKANDVIE